MPNFATIDDVEVAGHRVLVRADLNVPLRGGVISDNTRIERAAATVRELIAAGSRVILLSHFRRPLGQRVPEMSLATVAEAMSQALDGHAVAFAGDCIGPVAEQAVAAMNDGDVLLLENLRFHAGEETNDPEFARALAALGDVYLNDAFSAAHRAHASTEALASLLPAAAGRAMEAEIRALEKVLAIPERPLAAVIGGAKISTKFELLTSLIAKVDTLVIGGAMANTFLYARGFSVGRSLCEPEMADIAREVDLYASTSRCDLVLPGDVVVAESLSKDADATTVKASKVPADSLILDVGPLAVTEIIRRLTMCKTVFWNGPLGAFETPPFDAATNAVARAVAKLCSQGGMLAVAGGGDTLAALAHAGVADQFSYLSAAGGAFLEWVEGKELPGLAALARAAVPEQQGQVA